MDPKGSGNPKKPHKQKRQDSNEYSEGRQQSKFHYPVQNGYKPQAKEPGKHIGKEHGSVIEPGLGCQVLATMIAVGIHFKRPGK